MSIELVTKPMLIRDAPALVPATVHDLGRLANLPRGEPLRTVLQGPSRSRQQENWYRALVRLVADAIDKHEDTLHAELRWLAGKVLRILTSQAFGVAVQLKSCADMDDGEFNAYVALATDIIFKEFLPEVRRADVLREVDRMVSCPR